MNNQKTNDGKKPATAETNNASCFYDLTPKQKAALAKIPGPVRAPREPVSNSAAVICLAIASVFYRPVFKAFMSAFRVDRKAGDRRKLIEGGPISMASRWRKK